MFDKKVLFIRLCERLQSMIDGARGARKESESESRAHKGAMASRYDTFKEEAQALAGGHGKRELDLITQLSLIKSLIQDGQVLAQTEAIQTGAIVHIAELDSQKKFYYLIVPVGDGFEFQSDNTLFTTLNFSTPLGRALFYKQEGDIVEFSKQRLQILDVQ